MAFCTKKHIPKKKKSSWRQHQKNYSFYPIWKFAADLRHVPAVCPLCFAICFTLGQKPIPKENPYRQFLSFLGKIRCSTAIDRCLVWTVQCKCFCLGVLPAVWKVISNLTLEVAAEVQGQRVLLQEGNIQFFVFWLFSVESSENWIALFSITGTCTSYF